MRINKRARDAIDSSPVSACVLESDHELTYAILLLTKQYMIKHGGSPNQAVGAIESAKQEIYRKHITPSMVQSEYDHG
jgi:hypothetical protein